MFRCKSPGTAPITPGFLRAGVARHDDELHHESVFGVFVLEELRQLHSFSVLLCPRCGTPSVVEDSPMSALAAALQHSSTTPFDQNPSTEPGAVTGFTKVSLP